MIPAEYLSVAQATVGVAGVEALSPSAGLVEIVVQLCPGADEGSTLEAVLGAVRAVAHPADDLRVTGPILCLESTGARR